MERNEGMSSRQQMREQIQQEAKPMRAVAQAVGSVVVGQERLVNRLLVALLTDGHVLIEGLPGLAKTLAVRTLAATISADFQRIQFTPDLLPADLIGTLIYNPRTGEFTPRKGPIFTNIVLADEINRAPAKVQSALLEAMEERQITLGEETHSLANPFMVLATQNPIEQEGTYPLPEAQLDRFMLKVVVEYPNRDEERAIIDRMVISLPPSMPDAVVGPEQVISARQIVESIYVDDKIKDYVLDIVFATRDPGAADLKQLAPLIEVGASPRATLFLVKAARAYAFLNGRSFVTPEDIKHVAPDVLRHRIAVTFEAEAEDITPAHIVGQLLSRVAVP